MIDPVDVAAEREGVSRKALAQLVVYRLHIEALADIFAEDQLRFEKHDYADIIDCLRGASMLLTHAGQELGEIFDNEGLSK